MWSSVQKGWIIQYAGQAELDSRLASVALNFSRREKSVALHCGLSSKFFDHLSDTALKLSE